jgi:hypothetical protein
MKKSLLLLLFISFLLKIQATNYYVSITGTSTNNGLTSATPFPNIQKAADLTVGGDTVFIMGTATYTTTSNPILNITRSGTRNANIIYKGFGGQMPKIKGSGNVWNLMKCRCKALIHKFVS